MRSSLAQIVKTCSHCRLLPSSVLTLTSTSPGSALMSSVLSVARKISSSDSPTARSSVRFHPACTTARASSGDAGSNFPDRSPQGTWKRRRGAIPGHHASPRWATCSRRCFDLQPEAPPEPRPTQTRWRGGEVMQVGHGIGNDDFAIIDDDDLAAGLFELQRGCEWAENDGVIAGKTGDQLARLALLFPDRRFPEVGSSRINTGGL